MRLASAALLPLAVTACVASGPSVVSAPSFPATAPPAAASGATSSEPRTPAACGRPWKLDVLGGDARVVVVCASDVRREAFEETSAIARALFPALDPAHDKVCACAGRLRAPDFVDLVFTANPEEGRVTVRADGGEDLDPELGAAFVACVGTVVATFAPVPSRACPEAGKASLVYPVRLDLGPDAPAE